MQTKEDYLKMMNEIIEDIKELESKAMLAKFALFVSAALFCLSFVKGDLSAIDFAIPSVFMIVVGSLQSSADDKYTELYNSVMGLWDRNILLNEDDVNSLLFKNEKIQLIVDEKERERIDEAIGKYGVIGLQDELANEPTLKYSHRLRLGALERYLSALVEEDTDLKHFVQQNGRWVMNSIIPSLLLTYGIIVLYYITFNI